MKIVIAGGGMLGIQIAHQLIDEKHDVVIIEKDAEAARVASNELDCMVINNDGSRPEVLREAGVAGAAWYLALTGSDEVNIVSCGLVALESPKIRTVARVENPFYSELSLVQRRAFGLDVLINPALAAADTVARIVEEGFAEDVVPLHDGRLQLRYLEASAIQGFVDRTLQEIRNAKPEDFLIAAVVRDGALDVPTGDYRVVAGDWLYVLGTPDGLDRLLGPVAGVKKVARRVLVIGATKMSERLIQRLLEGERARGRGVIGMLKGMLKGKRLITFMDASRDEGKRFARAFQGIDVFFGDSSEEGLLEKAGIDKADLVVCATESQTYNILTAQLAKTLGAGKSVAITLNDRYLALGATLEVDALVSVKSVVAASVLELVRKAHIRTIHGFFEDDVEIVELVIGPNSPAAGKQLLELTLPKGTLVAFAIKGEQMVVPKGSTVLDHGDTVAFIVRKNAIPGLERAFGGTIGD